MRKENSRRVDAAGGWAGWRGGLLLEVGVGVGVEVGALGEGA